MRAILTGLLLLLLTSPGSWSGAGLVWSLTTHGQGSESVEREAVLGDFASGFVAEGCLPTIVQPPTVRQVTLPPCRAYALDTVSPLRRLRYFVETTPLTLITAAPDGFVWIAGRTEVEVTPPGWTNVPGRHYLWTTTTNTRPELPSGTVLLAVLTLKDSAITQVGDLRPDTPYRGSVNALSPLYGVKGDCQTVETAALQQVINAGLWRDREVYLPSPPGGCYKTGALWLHYHATGNPTAPMDPAHQGNLRLHGDGAMRYKQAAEARQYERTVLECVDPSQPCLNAASLTPEGEPNFLLRHLRLERFSVVGSSPGQYLISINGANNGAGMSEIYVLQKSQTGSGVKWLNSFIVDLTQVFIEYQNVVPAGRSTGMGLYLSNPDALGGNLDLRNVSAKGFDTCWQIGESTFGAGKRFQTINIINGQAGSCLVGMFIGYAVRGFSCTGCYFEGIYHYAMQFDSEPWGARVESSWFAVGELGAFTDAAIMLGNGTGAPGGRAQAITIANNVFNGWKHGYGVYLDTSQFTNSISIEGNYFAAGASPVSTVGVGCLDVFDQKGLRVQGNFFSPEVLTQIEPTCYPTSFVTAMDAINLGRTVSYSSGSAIASAATITIPTNGNTFNVTGSATVTTISCPQCKSGAQLRFVRAPGNDVTFAEGGNMNLSSAAGHGDVWTPTGFSILTLELYSTTWYEVSRSQN